MIPLLNSEFQKNQTMALDLKLKRVGNIQLFLRVSVLMSFRFSLWWLCVLMSWFCVIFVTAVLALRGFAGLCDYACCSCLCVFLVVLQVDCGGFCCSWENAMGFGRLDLMLWLWIVLFVKMVETVFFFGRPLCAVIAGLFM